MAGGRYFSLVRHVALKVRILGGHLLSPKMARSSSSNVSNDLGVWKNLRSGEIKILMIGVKLVCVYCIQT